MAFSQFRKARDEPTAKVAPAQTVEAMRRRAMHRLIGAAVLVLAGVIGFPLVFDTQPRPIPVDLPIAIADKNKVKPLVVPPPAPAVVSRAAPPAIAPAAVPAPAVEQRPAPVAAASVAVPTTAKAAVPVAETPVAKANDASKAQALLEGKEGASKAPPADGRFVVQVGAFTDQVKVREVRNKVEGVGLKTYTQVVETKDGSRTRVRLGPFPDKEQALRVAEKIRKLDLPAAIITL